MRTLKMSRNLKSLFNFTRRSFSSALYITGDKAHKSFAVLNPVIDFDKQFENKDVLEENIKARQLPLNVTKIEERWRFFEDISNQKKSLEQTRAKIGSYIMELLKDEEKNREEIEKYKLHLKLVKEDINSVKGPLYGLEEDTMLMLLNLPNVLHEKTPLELATLYEFLEKDEESCPSHMEIAGKKGLVEYTDPLTCFFKSDAALFEIAILNYFKHSLLDLNYTLFSNPNFCRSVVVEGCGIHHEEKNKVFILEQRDDSKDDINVLHLPGGATLFPFMAYMCKHYVQQTYFPLKYFSISKKYQPVSEDAPRDLLNLSQESGVYIFTATMEEDDLLDEITERVRALYEPLGYHFRLVYLPAKELDNSESLRLSVQMYSNHRKDYVEVGNVSCYDSYLSKRLLFTYSVNKERKYPKVIAGTVLNVPRVLACVLENNSVRDSDLISPLLEKMMFV